MKRKNISDSRSVENVSHKLLRIEFQPAQRGVEREKRFVNVYLHCIASNLKRISTISTLPPEKIFVDVHESTDFRSNSWFIKRGAVWFNYFNSFRNDKCQIDGSLNLYTRRSNKKALQF